MANNYEIDYSDKRFTAVEADKNAAMNQIDVTYGEMIGNADQYYQSQIDAAQNRADKQSQLQQEKTDFAIEQIEQQKQQAHKDYTKEQSGAYVDWQKQSDQYGANAEAMAAQGLAGSGYSESSQVSMYNTYQNRVATARESYNQAVLNYNNAIKDAQIQNNAALAEIAYQALQTQLELSLAGFQYKNTLIIEQANKKLEADNLYHQRYQDVLNQINHENALAEEVRQYNESMAEEIRQYNENLALNKEKFTEEQRQYNENLALNKEKLAEDQRQYNESLALQKAQLAEEQRQYNETMAYNKAKAAKSAGSSSGGGGVIALKDAEPAPVLDQPKEDKTATVRTAIDIIVNKGSDPEKNNTVAGNNKVKSEVNQVLNAAVKDGTMTKAEANAYKRAMRNQVF